MANVRMGTVSVTCHGLDRLAANFRNFQCSSPKDMDRHQNIQLGVAVSLLRWLKVCTQVIVYNFLIFEEKIYWRTNEVPHVCVCDVQQLQPAPLVQQQQSGPCCLRLNDWSIHIPCHCNKCLGTVSHLRFQNANNKLLANRGFTKFIF